MKALSISPKFKFIYSLFFTLVLFFSQNVLFAQADPCDYGVEGFNYQAIITDSDGNTVKNRPVKLKFQIQQFLGNELLTIYEESHEFTVAENGVVNLILGQGQRQSNSRFCEIHWEVGPTYLTRLIDLGDGFFEGGQTVFNSVPVAEFAKNAPMTSPWLIEASEEGVTTLLYPQQVIIGDSNNQNVPPLVVMGTDDGPTSPTAEFVRTGTRNNVINFTSEGNVVYDNQLRENDQLKVSMGILSSGYFPSSGHTFSIGTKKGLESEYTNPFTIEFGAPTESFSIDSEGQVFVPFKLYGDQFYSHYSQIDDLDANTVSATVYYGDGSQLTGIDMKNTTDELNNTALGTLAFNENEEGYNNTALGFQALQRNKTGNDNTALGIRTMEYNDSGERNVAVGGYTLYKNINGNDNTALGYGTLEFNENGNENTALGRRAMAENRSGDGNTAVGTEALMKNQNSANTSLGYFSGSENVSGTLNTFVGYKANSGGDQAANLKNATAIGAEAIVSENNTIQLGNEQVEQVITSGSISASGFVGDGSELTNVRGTLQKDEQNNILAGSEYQNLDTGFNNTGIGGNALTQISSGDNNTAFGMDALASNSQGVLNTAVGSRALKSNNGNSNVAVGNETMFSNTTGGGNTAVGTGALVENQTGSNNVALGHSAQYKTTGSNNSSVGTHALKNNEAGSKNTALGYYADVSSTDLVNATAIGAEAIVNQSNTIQLGNSQVELVNTFGTISATAFVGDGSGLYNIDTGVQFDENRNLSTTGSFTNIQVSSNDASATAQFWSHSPDNLGFGKDNIAISSVGMDQNSTGFGNVALGNNALENNQVANENTAIGLYSLSQNREIGLNTAVGAFALMQTEIGAANTAVGHNAMTEFKEGYMNIAMGNGTMQLKHFGHSNVALGGDAMRDGRLGNQNVAIGTRAGMHIGDTEMSLEEFEQTLEMGIPLASGNVAIGDDALTSNREGYGNVSVGVLAAHNLNSGNDNIVIGPVALADVSGEGNNEDGQINEVIAIGRGAMRESKNGSRSVAIGFKAMEYYSGTNSHTFQVGDEDPDYDRYSLSTAVGYQALRGSSNLEDNTGMWNTAVGYKSIMNNTSGYNNTAVGVETLSENTSGRNNTAMGDWSLRNNTEGKNNAAYGTWTLSDNVSGTWNTAIGHAAMTHNISGSSNTALGAGALGRNISGVMNIAIGNTAMYSSESARENIAIGVSSLRNITSGTVNTAVGHAALISNTIGEGNTAVGYHALLANETGFTNVAVGQNSLMNNREGSGNTALGYLAGEFSQESNNTFIGSYTKTSENGEISNATAIGAEAIVNQSNTIQLGNSQVELVNTFGTISATAFVGDGSGLYNIDTGVQFDENRNLSTTGSFTNIQVSSNDASATAQFWSHSPDNLGFGKDNIAISSVGMDQNSTGFGNVALGNNALENNQVANENTAIGLYSLSQNREIGLNTAVGAFALMQTEIGAANTAVGHNAMTEFKEGYMNIAMGNGTMQLKHFGHSNVALGGDAMRDGRLGNQNVAIGTRAGMHIGDTEMSLEEFEQTLEMGIPLASGNVAIGDDALTSNREGYGNVSVGVLAAHNLNSGNDNIVIGPVALADVSGEGNNEDGQINEVIAIGRGAMRESKNGSRSVAIGFKAMEYYSGTNSHTFQVGDEDPDYDRYSLSTAVGYQALRGSSNLEDNTGMWNTAVGYKSIMNNTSGYNNTAVGVETLSENTSGRNNTAMGDWSLRNNTEGKNNAAYGTWTLSDNVSGTWNTAIGHAAMTHNISGSSNTALGAGALGRNISGVMNIAIGNTAMYSSESARENIAIGVSSLRNITSGTVNTAVGHAALISNTIGEGNTAVGYHALLANETGFTNVAVGQNSLMNNREGSGNTALGYLAGEFSQESNNTFIGSYTKTSENGEISNATAIGAEAVVNSSNMIQLGNENVTLVNTSGTVSATAFVGDASSLTLAQDDTEDTVKTLLSIINDLTERIETLETNSTNTFDFGFGYNDDSDVEDQHYDLETQNMWDNDNTIWDLKLSDVGNTFYLDCGNNASIAVLNTPTQSLAKNISNYNFNDIDSLDDINSEDLYFYSDTTAISLDYLLDVVLIIKTNNNVNPQLRVGGTNKYYAVNVKYYYLNNNGNAGILNLEAKEIEGTSTDLF